MKPLFVAAVLAASAVTVTACTHKPPPPYHRNAADKTACQAYQEAAYTDAGADWVTAMTVPSADQDLTDLIVAAQERYGNQGAPVTWCRQHGYRISLPGSMP